jgi:predicted TIM-barrel fold metal-dependent hydrolase
MAMAAHADLVDVHTHVGISLQSNVDTTEEALLAAMQHYGIAAALVMPQPRPDMAVIEIHDRIARFADRNSGRIFGIANVNPLVAEPEYRREIVRCVCDLGFRAIKIHPLGHAVAPNSPRCGIVFALARELQVPVVIHTGTGAPLALPSLAIPPALAHPDVTVSLAHAGFSIYAAEAVVAAQVCPNIVLEPSWCTAGQIAGMIRSLGARRVMFGSDHITNIPVELAKLEGIGLTESDAAAYLAGTARRIFALPPS